MTYQFKTWLQMKPYNRDKWFIINDYVNPLLVEDVDNVEYALNDYVNLISDYGIDISKHALKNKSPMYREDENGASKQVGYVITGSSMFNNDYKGWVKQYIDCWVEIQEVVDVW